VDAKSSAVLPGAIRKEAPWFICVMNDSKIAPIASHYANPAMPRSREVCEAGAEIRCKTSGSFAADLLQEQQCAIFYSMNG
jgi:hypothetical protein